MKTLWLGAAAAALVCGSLAGCASPHYPLSETEAQGPAPLTLARPQYSIDGAPAHGSASSAAAPKVDHDAQPAAPSPDADPVAPVQSQALPPPRPSAQAGGAHLQYAALTDQDGSTTTPLPPATTPATPPPSAPEVTAPANDDTATLTPRMVIHDRPGGTAPTPAPATPRPETTTASSEPMPRDDSERPGMLITGAVVRASGVFEAYEVQKGDHVDQLARNFETTRQVLVDANSLKAPFTLHPGQVIKVPVAKAYVAKSGDTLGGVARRFQVSVGELAQMNHLAEHAELRAGEQVGLPSSMRDRGPLPATYAAAEASHRYTPSPHRVVQVVEQPPMTPPSAHAYEPIRPQTASPATAGLSDAEIARAAKGRFIWPVRGDILSHFGPMGVGQRNDGVDITAAHDSAVKAAAAGQVIFAGNQIPGYGNAVLVQHADGWVTVYAYLDKLEVHAQDQVTQGQEIGLSGMTTDSGKPAVHFEIRYHPGPGVKTQAVDPVLVLPLG